MRGIARGGAKSRKRFGGGLDPLTHVNISFRTHENRDLVHLEFSEPVEIFSKLRGEIQRFGMGFYFSEMIGGIFPEREANPEAFRILLWGLRRLEEGDDPEALSRKFEIKVIDLAGYRPRTGACRACGREHHEGSGFRFLVEAGEISCDTCAGGKAGTPVSGESLAVWNRVPRLGLKGLACLRLSGRVVEELGDVMSAYLAYHTGGSFRAKDFLHSIRGGG